MDVSLLGSGAGIGTLALGLIITGALAGLAAGTLGIGGGLILVPVLYTVLGDVGTPFESRFALAVGTGLAAMLPTALMLLQHHRQETALDIPRLARATPFAVAGAALGAIGVGIVPWRWGAASFAILALIVAALLLLAKPGRQRWTFRLPPWASAPIALLGGFTGIGASAVSAPADTLGGQEARASVAHGAGLDAVVGLTGAIALCAIGWTAHALPANSYGFVNLACFAVLAPAMFLTATFSAPAAKTINVRRLRIGVALFVLFSAGKMVWAVLG